MLPKPSANSPATVHEIQGRAPGCRARKWWALPAPRLSSRSMSIRKQVSNRRSLMTKGSRGAGRRPGLLPSGGSPRPERQACLAGPSRDQRRTSARLTIGHGGSLGKRIPWASGGPCSAPRRLPNPQKWFSLPCTDHAQSPVICQFGWCASSRTAMPRTSATPSRGPASSGAHPWHGQRARGCRPPRRRGRAVGCRGLSAPPGGWN